MQVSQDQRLLGHCLLSRVVVFVKVVDLESLEVTVVNRLLLPRVLVRNDCILALGCLSKTGCFL